MKEKNAGVCSLLPYLYKVISMFTHRHAQAQCVVNFTFTARFYSTLCDDSVALDRILCFRINIRTSSLNEARYAMHHGTIERRYNPCCMLSDLKYRTPTSLLFYRRSTRCAVKVDGELRVDRFSMQTSQSGLPCAV